MVTQLLQAWARNIARRAAQVFVSTPITPNMLTVFGFFLNAAVAAFLATGHLITGGLVLIFAALFDMLDGALAKITNRVTAFGGFLDSVVDRYSEAVVLLGLLLFYYWRPGGNNVIVETLESTAREVSAAGEPPANA